MPPCSLTTHTLSYSCEKNTVSTHSAVLNAHHHMSYLVLSSRRHSIGKKANATRQDAKKGPRRPKLTVSKNNVLS
eukprot:COSAG02_NODE_11659_length_1679_cov_1.816456_1_plen_74_part_10